MIVGLDLSLRAAAACAAPADWDHDLAKLKMGVWGSSLKADATPSERVKRIADIVEGVVKFCNQRGVDRRAATRADFDVGVGRVFVEEMTFGSTGAHAREVAELTGAVKHRLWIDLGIVAVPVVASRARKVLLQRLPRKDVKGYVIANVRRLGGPALTWTPDMIDALVVCNAGVELAGGTAMSFAGVD